MSLSAVATLPGPAAPEPVEPPLPIAPPVPMEPVVPPGPEAPLPLMVMELPELPDAAPAFSAVMIWVEHAAMPAARVNPPMNQVFMRSPSRRNLPSFRLCRRTWIGVHWMRRREPPWTTADRQIDTETSETLTS